MVISVGENMLSFSRLFFFFLNIANVFFSFLLTQGRTLSPGDKDRMKLNISLVRFILHRVPSVVSASLRFLEILPDIR